MRLYTFLTNLILAPLVLGNQGQSPNPSDILSIQHTLAQYPLLIDSKNFDGLSAVFTENVYTNYSPPLGVLIGLPTVIETLRFNLENLTTQHSLTTQSINILGNGHAETVTYLIATHFGINNTIYEGEVLTAYARYEDKLRVDGGVWKMYFRHLIYMVCPFFMTHRASSESFLDF
jgi:SnoaL-like domain